MMKHLNRLTLGLVVLVGATALPASEAAAAGRIGPKKTAGAAPSEKKPQFDPNDPANFDLDDLPDVMAWLRNEAGGAPNACSVPISFESISDFGARRSTLDDVSGGDKCSPEKFFKWVCENSSSKGGKGSSERVGDRVRTSAENMDALDIHATIALMGDAKAKDDANKALASFNAQPKPGRRFDEILSDLSPESHRAFYKTQSEKADEIANKKRGEFVQSYEGKAKRVLSALQDNLVNTVLERQRQDLLSQLPESPAGSKLHNPDSEKFINSTFERMKQAVREVEIDVAGGMDVCFGDQRNALITRPKPGCKMKIIVCPAVLASGNIGELAGAISGALGHSIDSCAMDSMSVGGFSLSGLLEPLRACVSEKVAEKDSTNVMPLLNPSSTVPNITDYISDATNKGSQFSAVPGAPHCALPLTSDELKLMSKHVKDGSKFGYAVDNSASESRVHQRDQSNDAVAQFYGNKALAEWLKTSDDAKGDKSELAREAFAPYCDAVYHAKGQHPRPELMLNRIVATDPDLREVICTRGSAAGARTQDKALIKELLSKDLFASKPKSPAKAQKGATCDAQLAAGFGEHLAGFAVFRKMDSKMPFDFLPLGGPTQGIGLTEAAAGEQGVVDASGDGRHGPHRGGEAKGKRRGGGGADGAALSTSAAYTKHLNDIQAALRANREKCFNIEYDPAQAWERACKGRSSGNASIALSEPERGAHSSIEVQCQARCICDVENACYRAEPFHVATKPRYERKLSKEAVDADIMALRYTDVDPEGRGHFSVAALACAESFPRRDDPKITEACKDPSRVDNEGRVSYPGTHTASFVGELSGAELNFGCQYVCGCDGKDACRARIANPSDSPLPKPADAGILAMIDRDRPYLRADGDAPFYLTPTAVSGMDLVSAGSGPKTIKDFNFANYPGNTMPGLIAKDPLSRRLAGWVQARKDTETVAREECKNQFQEWAKEHAESEWCPQGERSPSPWQSSVITRYSGGDDRHMEGDQLFMTSSYKMSYQCPFSCANRSVSIALIDQDPPLAAKDPSRLSEAELATHLNLDKPEDREKALRADWQLFKYDLDATCAAFAKGPHMGEPGARYRSNIKAACDKQMTFPILEREARATAYNGDATQAPIPFRCAFPQDKCDCEKYECSGAYATPLMIENDGDLRILARQKEREVQALANYGRGYHQARSQEVAENRAQGKGDYTRVTVGGDSTPNAATGAPSVAGAGAPAAPAAAAPPAANAPAPAAPVALAGVRGAPPVEATRAPGEAKPADVAKAADKPSASEESKPSLMDVSPALRATAATGADYCGSAAVEAGLDRAKAEYAKSCTSDQSKAGDAKTLWSDTAVTVPDGQASSVTFSCGFTCSCQRVSRGQKCERNHDPDNANTLSVVKRVDPPGTFKAEQVALKGYITENCAAEFASLKVCAKAGDDIKINGKLKDRLQTYLVAVGDPLGENIVTRRPYAFKCDKVKGKCLGPNKVDVTTIFASLPETIAPESGAPSVPSAVSAPTQAPAPAPAVAPSDAAPSKGSQRRIRKNLGITTPAITAPVCSETVTVTDKKTIQDGCNGQTNGTPMEIKTNTGTTSCNYSCPCTSPDTLSCTLKK